MLPAVPLIAPVEIPIPSFIAALALSPSEFIGQGLAVDLSKFRTRNLGYIQFKALATSDDVERTLSATKNASGRWSKTC